MTEFQLVEYQNYIFSRIRKLKFHIENLDTADNTITCTLINAVLDDIKHVVSCIELKDKHANNK